METEAAPMPPVKKKRALPAGLIAYLAKKRAAKGQGAVTAPKMTPSVTPKPAPRGKAAKSSRKPRRVGKTTRQPMSSSNSSRRSFY